MLHSSSRAEEISVSSFLTKAILLLDFAQDAFLLLLWEIPAHKNSLVHVQIGCFVLDRDNKKDLNSDE